MTASAMLALPWTVSYLVSCSQYHLRRVLFDIFLARNRITEGWKIIHKFRLHLLKWCIPNVRMSSRKTWN